MSEEFVLEMDAISKEYYGNYVLKNVSLAVRPGEILGLVGENGAGKSTLMNILFGMPVIEATGGYQGEVRLDGKPVRFRNPREAIDAGIGMVHQEFMLIPGFSVAENIKLNREPLCDTALSRFLGDEAKTLNWERMRKDSRGSLDTVGLGIDEMLPVLGLPIGFMQFIEVAREVDKSGVRLLVFDEPTALLTESEASELLRTLRRLADRGIAIIFITHRLEEVLEVCDNLTVLRDGEVVGGMAAKDASLGQIAEMMVGRKVERPALPARPKEPTPDDVVLRLTDLTVDMPGEEVKGVTLDIRRGEILGIGGLAGQGKTGISNGIMGLFPAAGTVEKDGMALKLNVPGDAYRRGIAFLSEDRKGVGLILDRHVEYNITVVATLVKGRFQKVLPGGIRLRDKREADLYARQAIKDLDIRCTGPAQVVRRLSGGNQQKVCIARALALDPEVLLVSEPTRGIDVGAKEKVLDLLVRLNREKGVTIVLTSSELTELRKVCDRIAIIYGGRLVDILMPEDGNVKFGLAMAGRKEEPA
ncbi:MAG: sugar ABC transporter ATP-binding protein [Bacillota bacterium]